MKPLTRVLILIATLLIPVALFKAIWTIQLWAPQYPEGLEMQIWVDRLTGDVTIINGLNHYIGMANIEESMFPELKFLKYIFYGLIAIGLLTVFINKKYMLHIFTFLLVAVALAALVDMYIWGYKYGHNLDPHAAIRIEGESYQPPLIGYKQLLNFLALSAPETGGYALFGSGVLAVIAWIYQQFRDRKLKRSSLVNQLTLVFFSLLLASCQPGSETLNYGVDACDHCGMKLVDKKFGTLITTQKGKTFRFDDVNCMMNYIKEHHPDTKSIKVTDFSNPGTLTDADKAFYLKSEEIKSPMGSSTACFAVSDSMKRISTVMKGNELTWTQVQENSE